MPSTMLGMKTLVGMTTLLVLGASLPAALADEISRARTDDAQCVLVAWTAQPYVVSTTTGCVPSDPCVHVNWGTVPPEATLGDC